MKKLILKCTWPECDTTFLNLQAAPECNTWSSTDMNNNNMINFISIAKQGLQSALTAKQEYNLELQRTIKSLA